MDIIGILQKGEGKTTEFKRDLSSPQKILKTIIAFANTSGGTLIIGIDNDGNIRGVDNALQAEELVSNIISDSISPQILPNIEVVSWRDRELLALEICHGNQKPYFLKSKDKSNGTFIRIGSSNRLAGPEMLEELKRYTLNRCYDEEPFLERNSEGLDIQNISECLSAIDKKPTETLFKTLRFHTPHGKKIVPTNGAYILFGKDRLSFFPDARIQAALFAGTDKSEIIDSINVEEPLVRAIEQTMSFILRNIPKPSKIEGLYRRDVYRYPPQSLRECLVNAIVHCDYAQRGTPITVSIFSDRIEITNPGALPFGLTLEDIFKGVSKLRNRVIGRFFREINLIEQWGSGIGRVLRACKEFGLPEPVFEELGTHFRVTLHGTSSSMMVLDDDGKAIIEAIRAKGELSTKDIAKIIGKTERTARTKMLGLIKKGLVVEIGSSPQDPQKTYTLTQGRF